jgi:hypothetical protein
VPAAGLTGAGREWAVLALERRQFRPKCRRLAAGPAGPDAADRDQRAVGIYTEQQASHLIAIVGPFVNPQTTLLPSHRI